MEKEYTKTAGGGSFCLLLFCYFLMGRAWACLKANERECVWRAAERKLIERVKPLESWEGRWEGCAAPSRSDSNLVWKMNGTRTDSHS